ncbi:MAG: CHAT domain-containing protein [Vicinamibacterales bacterium]
MAARPAFTPSSFAAYARGRGLAAEGRLDEAVEAWRAAATASGDEAASAWLLLQAGIVLSDGKRLVDAERVTSEALTAAARTANRAVIAGVQAAQARLYERQNDVAKAAERYRAVVATRQGAGAAGLGVASALVDQASMQFDRENLAVAESLLREVVEIQRRLAPGRPALAESLSALGNVLRARNDFAAAAPLLRESADTLERLAPDTMALAVALNNLANLRWRQGATEEAAALYRRALGILEQSEPSSTATASSLMGLAVTAHRRGRLAEAEPYYRRALSLEERLAPGTVSEARALNNLGVLLYNRGALQESEEFSARALAVHQRIAPESQNVAQTLHNIGLLHRARGDDARAEDYLTRALALKERLAPGGFGSATTLSALGNLARDRGDPQTAEAYLQRALALHERQAPLSLEVATSHSNLGNVAMDRGDLDAARERFATALGLLERIAPDGIEMATVLDRQAALAERRSEASEAERLATRGAEITARVAPDSAVHAFIQRRLGRLARDRGDLAGAAARFASSLDAVESQSQRLGGSSEVRTAYAGQRRTIYLEYIDVLMALGQPAGAFDVLERSRARALLALLAERDLVLDGDLAPELKQALQALREDDDRLQDSLARQDPLKDAPEIARLRSRQREVRETRSQLIAKVRVASPRLAALKYSRALDLTQTQEALDPGTVLLSYQVGIDASRLFVVRRTSSRGNRLAVHTIAMGEAGLQEQVTALRRLIERDAGARDGASQQFIDAARRLYDLLVAPAAGAIAGSRRVLIVPDGSLHSLPFASLVRSTAGTGSRPWQYLVEWKPLHTALSATVYAELRKRTRPAARASTLVAFGDPQYPPTAPGPAAGSVDNRPATVERSLDFAPLPATRAEVEALSKGFGKRATVYLGAEATEARVKSLAMTRYLHFATHGLLDAKSPLDSALVLTIPPTRRAGQENGLLQAWEIFEQLRIAADLVTLSACETALGSDVAGEGLIGLTRAFHYAGARTVLASLWRVADDSTADLMTKFYAHLQAGVAKDAALRRAQLDAIARPTTAVPFHWAAFTLSGDWRGGR